MTSTSNVIYLGAYTVALGLTIASNYIDALSMVHYAAKPAMMLLLMLFFFKNGRHLDASIKRFTYLALLGSCIGDALLMFSDANELYFIGGLIAFLLAHVMYCIVFIKRRNKSTKLYGVLGILLGYAALLFWVLKDGLGALTVPVLVYMAVILSMAATAYSRKGAVAPLSFNYVIIGAIFFLISDSLLALNKFYQPMSSAGFTVIFTYAVAQYLIIKGLTLQKS